MKSVVNLVSILLVWLLSLLCTQLSAQVNLDSLRLRLQQKLTVKDFAQTTVRLGSAYGQRKQNDSALVYLKKGIELIEPYPRDTINIHAALWYATCLMRANKEMEAIPYFEEVYNEKQVTVTDKQRSYLGPKLASFYQRTGNIKKGIEVLMNTEPIAKRINDRRSITDIYYTLGLLYGMDGNHDKVKNYWLEALAMLPPDDYHRRGRIANSLGSMYVKGGRPKQAIPYLVQAHEAAVAIQSYTNAYFTLGNLADAYIQDKQVARAEVILDTILATKNQYKIPQVYVQCLGMKAQALEYRGKLKQALILVDSAIALYKKTGESSALPAMLSYKARLDSINGNYKASLTAIKQVQQIKDSVYSEDKLKAIEEMRVKFDTERVEEKNEQLTEDLETATTLRNLYIGIALISIGLAILLVLLQRQRVKITRQQKQIAEQELARVAQEQERIQQEAEAAAEKLELQEALALAERNEKEATQRALLAANTLSSHRKELLGKVESAIREYPQLSRKLQDLLDTVDDSKELEDEWETYKNNFLQLHPGFFERLLAHNAELTPYDQRLAAYIKLGLSVKEIAGLLSVTEPSIHNSRSRLRKKLGIETSQDLTSFIVNL